MISKGLFAILEFSQKMNEQIHYTVVFLFKHVWFKEDFRFKEDFCCSQKFLNLKFIVVVKMNSFVNFLGEFEETKSPFKIIWPLQSVNDYSLKAVSYKEAFNNYVDRILPFFDTHPRCEQFFIPWAWTKTDTCPGSYWIAPKGFNAWSLQFWSLNASFVRITKWDEREIQK